MNRTRGMSRGEMDAKIFRLYEKGDCTISQICKELKVGVKRVNSVIKKFEEETKPAPVSIRSQVYDFFNKGEKNGNTVLLVDAAIRFNLSPEEVKMHYVEWLDIRELDQLRNLFNDTKGKVCEFLSFYKECNALDIDLVTISKALPVLDQIPTAQAQLAAIRHIAEDEKTAIRILVTNRQKLNSDSKRLNSERVQNREV